MLHAQQTCIASRLPAEANQDSWMHVRGRLRTEVGEESFSSWLARMEFEGIDSETVRLSVPTRFLMVWIKKHYTDRVLACWKDEDPSVRRIEIVLRSCERKAIGQECAPAPNPRNPSPVPAREMPLRPAALIGSPLSHRLTFDTFVIGPSNTLAHSAAKQVALATSDVSLLFNPLYVYAPAGMGKTHLLQAIAWDGDVANRRTLYFSSEKFMFGFASSALAMKDAFIKFTEQPYVMLIDDIQFIASKSSISSFSHTISMMIDAGRQVVVAADRPPLDLENLDERVRSRLAGGLVVEMGALGEELRMEILTARVAAARLHHPDFNVPTAVLAHIAKSVANNGRDLEGALNRLLAVSKLTGQPITLELAEREIRDLICPAEPRKVKIEEIIRVVARHYGVSRYDIISARRTANVVRPRQIGYWLAKNITLKSLPEIGRRFGGRDHTSALSGIRKIDRLLETDCSLAAQIEKIKRELLDGATQ